MNSRPYRNLQRRPCAARRSISRRARRSRHDTDIGLLTDVRFGPRATAFPDDDRHCKNYALARLYRAKRSDFRRPLPGRNNRHLWRSDSGVRPTPISSRKSFLALGQKPPAKQNTFVRAFSLRPRKFQRLCETQVLRSFAFSSLSPGSELRAPLLKRQEHQALSVDRAVPAGDLKSIIGGRHKFGTRQRASLH